MKSTIQCQLCDKEWRENQVIPLENVPDLLQRIAPGEVVPFGECPDPKCGGLCHQVEVEDLVRQLVPLLMPELLEGLSGHCARSSEIDEKVQFYLENKLVLDYDDITAEVAQRADGYPDDFGATPDLDEVASEVAERLQVTVREN